MTKALNELLEFAKNYQPASPSLHDALDTDMKTLATKESAGPMIPWGVEDYDEKYCWKFGDIVIADIDNPKLAPHMKMSLMRIKAIIMRGLGLEHIKKSGVFLEADPPLHIIHHNNNYIIGYAL